VGVDAGNGTAGLTAVPILKTLGCEVHELYTDPGRRFPNHEADPTVAANMADLVALVRAKHLDVGLGFDGDGDRIGVVDADGRLIYGDQLMILFSREILARKPGRHLHFRSQMLPDHVRRHHRPRRRAVMWKTGHSMIKQKMKEVGAELAGEMSGHIFLRRPLLGLRRRGLRRLSPAGNPGRHRPNHGRAAGRRSPHLQYPRNRVACPDRSSSVWSRGSPTIFGSATK
jgi:phosphomannomutase / phosphoglucomutase